MDERVEQIVLQNTTPPTPCDCQSQAYAGVVIWIGDELRTQYFDRDEVGDKFRPGVFLRMKAESLAREVIKANYGRDA